MEYQTAGESFGIYRIYCQAIVGKWLSLYYCSCAGSSPAEEAISSRNPQGITTRNLSCTTRVTRTEFGYKNLVPEFAALSPYLCVLEIRSVHLQVRYLLGFIWKV